ncbi:MAG TPA: hypothetical protein VK509_25855 [Polyangiales bacterium]|nr:hypothetical protein [Polyangiales bacterium]
MIAGRRAWGLALWLVCSGGAERARAQRQEPEHGLEREQEPAALAEQLLAAMLQAGRRVGAAPSDAPESERARSDREAAVAPAALPLPPQTIYRYRNARGRVVYTNSAEQIPVQERERAKVDLSHIELNSELGTELNRRLEQRYARLTGSPRCEQLRKDASLGFVERLWEDFGPLVVCGGLLLLFVLFTPIALRRFGGPVWARTLMMAIPALAVAGLVTFSMRETGRALSELKQQAAPCEPGGFASLGGVPNAVMRRAALVRQLQNLVMPVPASGELPPPPSVR